MPNDLHQTRNALADPPTAAPPHRPPRPRPVSTRTPRSGGRSRAPPPPRPATPLPTTPRPRPPPARPRMHPPASRRTLLDGGWWPRSTDPVAELPGLILAIDALRGP